ncbi:MAG: translocation/assembly module TamB domain-containing protein [Chitinispirillaceae bacterium]|nr:translocation/assembly module TamB domain-containing protein [Chitinispirillaceae bacterium]
MKRVFFIAALVMASVITVLCAGLVLCVKLDAVHRLVISRVNKAIPGTLTLGRLDISIGDLRVEIHDVTLADSSGKKLAGFDRFLVDVSLPRLLRRTLVVEEAVLEHPRVVLEVDSGGHLLLLDAFPPGRAGPRAPRNAEPDRKSKPFPIEVRSLAIINGKILFTAEQDSLRVQAQGFSVTGNGETESLSADVTVILDSAALERAGERLNLQDFSLMARMHNRDIDTVDVRLRTGLSALSLHGSVSSPVDSPFVNVTADAVLALSEIRRAVGLDKELSGTTKLRMHLRGRVANPDLDLDVAYLGGAVMGYPVDSLFLSAHLADRVLELTALHVETDAGGIDAAGDIDARGMFPDGFLAAPRLVQKLRYDLAISGDGITLKNLTPGLSGTAAVSMALGGQGAHPDSLAATLGVSARVTALRLDTSSLPLDAAVACSAAVERGTALVHRLTGMLGSTALSLSGRYRIPTGAMDAAVNITVPALDTLLGFAGIDGVSGKAAVSAHVGGDLKNPEAVIDVNADTVAIRNMRVGNVALAAGLERDGTASVKRLALANGNSQLQLSGSAKVLDHGALLPVDRMTFETSLVSPGLFINDFFDSTGGVNLSGVAAVAVYINGDMKHPQASIELKADTIVYGTVRLGNIALDGELEPNGTARVQRLALANGNSQVQCTGSAKVLDNGTLLPFDRMMFDGSLVSHDLNIRDFIDSVEGAVKIDAQVRGTMEDLRGHLLLSAADLAAAGQHIARINLDARLDGQRATIQPLRIMVSPGQDLTLTGWASMKDSFNVTLSVPGIYLNSIAALASLDSLDGIFSMDLQAGGTYAQPEALGTLGIGAIRIGAASLDDIGLRLDLHDQHLEVSGTAGGDLHAGYNLDTKAFAADLTCNNLLLTPYLALSGRQLEGSLTAAVRVSGNADTLSGIIGTLDIADLKLSYNGLRIIETHGLHALLERSGYSVPDFTITLAGEGAIKGHAHGLLEGPHDAVLNGIIPLSIARHFAPDLGEIEGSVVIDAFFKGTATASDLKADVRLKDIGMTVPGLSQRLHSLNGRILADPKKLRIETLRGNLDDGVFTMKGEVALDELAPSKMRAEITFSALPLGIPDMLDMVLNARLRLAGTPDTAQVTGNITLLDGLYYQDVVINPFTGIGRRNRKEAAAPAEITMPYLRNMRFDVGVRARSPLRVDNNLAQLTIAPDLQLTGTLAAPSLLGRADVEQGTVTYLRKVFTVDRGIIDFVNPYAIEPNVDIKGTIPVQDRLIQLTLSGTPDDLVFKLAAYYENGIEDDNMEDQDILSLLVLGKTTAELQSNLQSGDMGQSNQQMIASLVASTFGEDIKKAAGLDVLEVETGSDSSDNSDRIAVTVGKMVTKRLETKYTIESEAGEIVQRAAAEYRILQDLFISGFQDTRGVYGGELRYQWERR